MAKIRYVGPWEQKPNHRSAGRWKDWLFYGGIGLVSGAGMFWLVTDREATDRVASFASRNYLQIGCSIKGNISMNGEHIYHVPGQAYYSATRIDTVRGERWFCSEEEARSAGWRKARR